MTKAVRYFSKLGNTKTIAEVIAEGVCVEAISMISTHEGSGLANMVSDVKRLCVGADVQENGLAIRGSQAKNSRQKVADWL